MFLHANRRSSFRSRFEITELLTYSDANYSIGPHQKCYVRNLKRGGGEFWVAQILKELLSQLSAILGSCPHLFCRRGQKRASPNNLPKGRLLGRAEPKRLRLPSSFEKHFPVSFQQLLCGGVPVNFQQKVVTSRQDQKHSHQSTSRGTNLGQSHCHQGSLRSNA